MEALPRIPGLNATSYLFVDAFQMQLTTLAVNASCTPLCAFAGTKNGYLFTVPETRHALLGEISQVIQALSELQGASGIVERFSVNRLEATVNRIIDETRHGTCSMVVDLRQEYKTEIGFINGYWCRRGKEVRVPTPLNDDLVRRIHERHTKNSIIIRLQRVITCNVYREKTKHITHFTTCNITASKS